VCCQDAGASEARDYVKARIKELGLAGKDQLRINAAGCLDRCEEGPVVVVYPEGVWYSYVDKEDLDEIIEEHLVHGRVVERLKI
jgi:(2Fe-2S) ferredoxin